MLELTILNYLKRFFYKNKTTASLPANPINSAVKKSYEAVLNSSNKKNGHPHFHGKKVAEKNTPLADPSLTHNSSIQNVSIQSASKYGIIHDKISKNALYVVEKLNKNGYQAYLVGGCIRDILLNNKPKDFDIATNARPEQIQQLFHRQCRLVGRRFRLAHIVFTNDIIEVATFRADHINLQNENYAKTNHEGMLLRDNVYGSLEQDAQRRDFTINAFYYDPIKDIFYDYFYGLNDLKAGKLKLYGDPVTRYHEDPVRMLRSIRFMAKLDMFLDKPSAEPITKLAPLLKNIPAARLFDETLKLLQTGFGSKAYPLLRKYNLFTQLFPLLTPYFTEQGDNFTERMIVIALASTDQRIKNKLPVNPAFLFCAFIWYPFREKVEILKNEGGLNNHDAYPLAADEILNNLTARLLIPRRYTSVIRTILFLQLQLLKRTGNYPAHLLINNKFRAAYDLLVMRADIEGEETAELANWWHEYQFGNLQQRADLVSLQQAKRHHNNAHTKHKSFNKHKRKFKPKPQA